MKDFEHGGDVYRNKVRLDFSSNINPFGLPETASRAIAENAAALSRYPDAEYERLRRAIAEKEKVSPDEILCGNGASELIFSLARAINPKRALLISPTFSEYERALFAAGCDIKYYALNEENGFAPTERFLDFLQDIDMVFICNPNNPVGNVIDEKLMRKILGKCREKGITAVVDECFMDFVKNGYSAKGNAVIIKAFTKFYAMAGLRLGYMIGDAEFIKKIKKALPAWNVNAAAEAAATAALADTEYAEKSRRRTETERKYLINELEGLGFKTYGSKANFVFFKGDAKIYDGLLNKGILIRQCDNFRGLDGRFYRAAVRLHEENEELIQALRELKNG